MKVSVISSCYGNYDEPWAPVPQDGASDIEWVMVRGSQDEHWPGWVNVVEDRPFMHPNMAAKVAKCCPEYYATNPTTIWVDAGSVITSQLASEVTSVLRDYDIAMFQGRPHWTLEDELLASRTMQKYGPLNLEGQVQTYRSGGYDSTVMWGTGLMGRTGSFDTSVGAIWLSEMTRWGYQDQLSFAHTEWSCRLSVGSLGDGRTSPYIKFADHTGKAP